MEWKQMRGITEGLSLREEMYDDTTDEIFEHMEDILEAIADHLGHALPEMEWKDLELYESRVLAIHAIAPLSKKQKESGVDDTLRRNITIGIPIDIIENGNIDDVKEFLSSVETTEHVSSSNTNEDGITKEEWEAMKELSIIPKDKLH